MLGGRNKGGVKAYAEGGIITRPHLGLVGEAGREAIIPLERQTRGTELWLEVGRELGLISESNPTENMYTNMSLQNSVNRAIPNAVPEIVNAPRFQPNVEVARELNLIPAQNYDVIPNIVNALRFQPDIDLASSGNVITNTQRTSQAYNTSGGIFSQSDIAFMTAAEHGVMPSIANTLRVQPNVQLMASADRNMTVNNQRTLQSYNATSDRSFAVGSQIREMISRTAENSVMREVLERAVPQVMTQQVMQSLTNNIASTKITDRTDQTSTLRDIITRSAEHSVLSEAYNRFTGENSVLREFTTSFTPVIPHAEGGIFSTPHIGLVAEAGREAVIPLEDKSRGIPLLMAAANEMLGENIVMDQPYSLPMLVQQSQNQAIMSGQALAQTMAQPTESQSASNSKVTVNVDVKPADVYIDSERIGRISFRWSERQSIRSGMGS